MAQDHPGPAPNDDHDFAQDHPQDTLDRITVAQAAERLGVSQDAVRKRIARGTIRHDRGDDGRIFVYLDIFERASNTVQDEPLQDPSKTVQDEVQDKYTQSLEDQIQFLRRELERKDTIILSLVQRVPQLEAPRDEPHARETASDDDGGTDETPGEDTGEPRGRSSWWRRWFGFHDRGAG